MNIKQKLQAALSEARQQLRVELGNDNWMLLGEDWEPVTTKWDTVRTQLIAVADAINKDTRP